MSPAALPKLTAEHRRLLGELAVAKVQLSLQKAGALGDAGDRRSRVAIDTEMLLMQLVAVVSGSAPADALHRLLDWPGDDFGSAHYDSAEATLWHLRHTHDEIAQRAPKGQPHAHPPGFAPNTGPATGAHEATP